MADEVHIISATVVFPATAPAIQDGAIAIAAERIVGIGKVGQLRHDFPNARQTQHRDSVMLPGLVNAHTHLELSYQRRTDSGPVKFTEWVARLMRAYPVPDQLEQVIAAAAMSGARECLKRGVTTVGDISRQCAITRPVLRDGPLRVVSFGEVAALGTRRDRLEPLLALAAENATQSKSLRVGLSPHAPYSVEGPALRSIVDRAMRDRLPLAMHLAELAEEGDFLRDLSGPLGWQWGAILGFDILDEKIPLTDGGPVAWAEKWGLLAAARKVPVVLAHVNYASEAELRVLAEAGASVVYCPRTRHYFGHDHVAPHRFQQMLALGINVSLGTDSLASNPDLGVQREAQFLISRDASLDADVLLQMMTINGAKALGTAADTGSLELGKYADLVVLPVPPIAMAEPERLLRKILSDGFMPKATYISGELAAVE